MIDNISTAFTLGQIVVTSKASVILSQAEILGALKRHAACDWGLLTDDDARMNDDALQHGNRIHSVYGEGAKRFWIITEADRSVTTILMPDDY